MKGRMVLMLEPAEQTTGQYFRILDLPIELRKMIYNFVIEEGEIIDISTWKPTNQPYRPVRSVFWQRDQTRKRNKTSRVNRSTGKWIGTPPDEMALMRVNHEFHQEAVTLLYSVPIFTFQDWGGLAVFLDTVGSMRKHLRQIKLIGEEWQKTKVARAANLLKDATNLRALIVKHNMICEDYSGWRYYRRGSPDSLVAYCLPFLRALQTARKSSGSAENVLDIIKLEEGECGDPCDPAVNAGIRRCFRTSCGKTCEESAAHHQAVVQKIRKSLAGSLGIEDGIAKEVEG